MIHCITSKHKQQIYFWENDLQEKNLAWYFCSQKLIPKSKLNDKHKAIKIKKQNPF